MHAWFNDPDSDCVSTEWYVEFTYDNGEISIWDPERWYNETGGTSYDFGADQWDCCSEYVYNEGSNLDACDCGRGVSPNGTIIIDCSICNGE